MNTFEEHFPQIENLLRGYSHTYRASTQPFHQSTYIDNHPGYTYRPDDPHMQESLLEHVGMLPVLATYLHPFIASPVDLGHALSLLAVHDLGEIVVGDENTFTKPSDQGDPEADAARALLHADQQALYQEYLDQETNEAKFAKSVDKMAPDLYDIITDAETNAVRFKHYVNIDPHEIPALIEKHKSPHMLWDPFIKDFHAGLIKKLEGLYNK